MACFGTLLRKKKRGRLSIFTSQDQTQSQSSKVGAYWEFSYVYYDKETGNSERAETCQPKPQGNQMELLLFVKRRGETASAIDRKTLEKNHAVKTEREEKGNTKESILHDNNMTGNSTDDQKHKSRKK